MAKAKDYVNHGGLSRQVILQSRRGQSQALGTYYMNLLQIHRFDKDVPIEETMEALRDLVIMGKVRCINVSLMWTY
jgi:aryl-alcohol dehydrogenase-like predicted oxidoreductase